MQSNNLQPKVENRRKEIETALNEIVDTIERYFLVAPFQWIEGQNGELGYHVFPEPKTPFNYFQPWNDDWMGKLFPEAHEAQRKLAEEDHGDEPGELAYAAQRFGFLCGVLIGCKIMGATREQLLEKARGFAILAIVKAEREANYEEEKANRARNELTAAERRREMTVIDGGARRH
jgi:hypothetical protein